MATDDSDSIADKIGRFREAIQRREKSKRAKRRAKSRRIEQEKPEGASEKAQVAAKRTKRGAREAQEEASGLAQDAKQLLATELGVSGEQSESIIEEGARLLESAGEKAGQLDVDGDGDTDILQTFESQTAEDDMFGSAGGSSAPQPQGSRGSEPVQPESLEAFDPMSVDEVRGGGSGSSQDSIDPTSREFEEDLLDL